MTMEVNQSVKSAAISTGPELEKVKGKRNRKEILLKMQQKSEKEAIRMEKFKKLQVVYIDKAEYKAALEKANAEGKFNPDAPEFIFADKKMVKNLQKLEQSTGQKIFRNDGTINTANYKKALLDISGDLDIDATEKEFAQDSGLSKSELRNLAKPLGIEILGKDEKVTGGAYKPFVIEEVDGTNTVYFSTDKTDKLSLKLEHLSKEKIKDMRRSFKAAKGPFSTKQLTAEQKAQLKALHKETRQEIQANVVTGTRLDATVGKFAESIGIVAKVMYSDIRTAAKSKGVSNVELLKIFQRFDLDKNDISLKDLEMVLYNINQMPDIKE